MNDEEVEFECDICHKTRKQPVESGVSLPDGDFGQMDLYVCLICLDEIFGEAIYRKKSRIINKLLRENPEILNEDLYKTLRGSPK